VSLKGSEEERARLLDKIASFLENEKEKLQRTGQVENPIWRRNTITALSNHLTSKNLVFWTRIGLTEVIPNIAKEIAKESFRKWLGLP
jgi:transcription initiation factor TFIIIB Brf1 subunit/transcription initiation factor TFIIB